jgi:hypothetical protein
VNLRLLVIAHRRRRPTIRAPGARAGCSSVTGLRRSRATTAVDAPMRSRCVCHRMAGSPASSHSISGALIAPFTASYDRRRESGLGAEARRVGGYHPLHRRALDEIACDVRPGCGPRGARTPRMHTSEPSTRRCRGARAEDGHIPRTETWHRRSDGCVVASAGSFLRFVHGELTPVEVAAVESRDRRLRLFRGRHLHEAEPA